MKKAMKELLVLLVTSVLMLAMIAPFVWVSAKWEADAYNRLTGHNVSTWDAVWLDLRVQDAPVGR